MDTIQKIQWIFFTGLAVSYCIICFIGLDYLEGIAANDHLNRKTNTDYNHGNVSDRGVFSA